jgi:hypothetical protein
LDLWYVLPFCAFIHTSFTLAEKSFSEGLFHSALERFSGWHADALQNTPLLEKMRWMLSGQQGTAICRKLLHILPKETQQQDRDVIMQAAEEDIDLPAEDIDLPAEDIDLPAAAMMEHQEEETIESSGFVPAVALRREESAQLMMPSLSFSPEQKAQAISLSPVLSPLLSPSFATNTAMDELQLPPSANGNNNNSSSSSNNPGPKNPYYSSNNPASHSTNYSAQYNSSNNPASHSTNYSAPYNSSNNPASHSTNYSAPYNSSSSSNNTGPNNTNINSSKNAPNLLAISAAVLPPGPTYRDTQDSKNLLFNLLQAVLHLRNQLQVEKQKNEAMKRECKEVDPYKSQVASLKDSIRSLQSERARQQQQIQQLQKEKNDLLDKQQKLDKNYDLLADKFVKLQTNLPNYSNNAPPAVLNAPNRQPMTMQPQVSPMKLPVFKPSQPIRTVSAPNLNFNA